jgi:alpha-amylase
MIKYYVKVLVILICLFNISHSRSKEEWKTRTIYQIITDRFARSNGDKTECHDLKKYCGGTWRGIINNLDYIQGMGFNAIWISPVVENTPDSYHGYHFTNLYNLNDNFGTEDDFRELISECHERDIWIMIDVVANHVGPVGMSYGHIHPFNKISHYHDYCVISYEDFKTNQWRVEVRVLLI